MRRKTSRKVPEQLTKPVRIHWHEESLLKSREEADTANRAAVKAANIEVRNKLPLLFNYFQLRRTGDPAIDYHALAFNLAVEFIPGFRIEFADKQGRGRPKVKLAELLADAELVKREKRLLQLATNDSQLAEVLTCQLPYSRRWGRYKGKERSLLNQLRFARDHKRNPVVWFLQQGPDGVTMLINLFGSRKRRV